MDKNLLVRLIGYLTSSQVADLLRFYPELVDDVIEFNKYAFDRMDSYYLATLAIACPDLIDKLDVAKINDWHMDIIKFKNREAYDRIYTLRNLREISDEKS